MNGRLEECQSVSERLGWEKKLLPLTGIKPWYLALPVRGVVTMLTELSRLKIVGRVSVNAPTQWFTKYVPMIPEDPVDTFL